MSVGVKTLAGGKLAGGNPENGRVEHDFYATNPKAVDMLFNSFNEIDLSNCKVLEPSAGQGHICNALRKLGVSQLDCVDIVDRGLENVICTDFLGWNTQKRYNLIITNPPFCLAQEFIEKSFELLDYDGYVIMFLKIQFLEGAKRKDFYDKYPPKYVYVFRNRMATWNNGNERDPNGKRWATTMCHAWFIWQRGFNGEPIIRWL